MRDKLEAVRRQTGITPKELENLLECPEMMVFVWQYFLDLHNTRSSTGFGVNPITYQEIKAYSSIMGIQLDEWEVRVIKRLDHIALEHFAEVQEKQQKAKSKK